MGNYVNRAALITVLVLTAFNALKSQSTIPPGDGGKPDSDGQTGRSATSGSITHGSSTTQGGTNGSGATPDGAVGRGPWGARTQSSEARQPGPGAATNGDRPASDSGSDGAASKAGTGSTQPENSAMQRQVPASPASR